ncbi:MAG: hypothetical protein FWF17_03170 [Betaproteobacteria bacterium]|nr:hypothetical protein [Betaproteobacteria bacterium]
MIRRRQAMRASSYPSSATPGLRATRTFLALLAAALCQFLAAAPAWSAPLAQATRLITANGEVVDYYFLAADAATVRDALLDSIPSGKSSTEGEWEDVGTTLAKMPYEQMRYGWIKAAVANRPDIRAALLAKLAAEQQAGLATPQVRAAVAAGVITPAEIERFFETTRNQRHVGNDIYELERQAFAAEHIRRWRYFRYHGKYSDDLLVMDLMPILRRGPMTLLRVTGSKSSLVGREFHLFSRRGRYVHLDPHIRRIYEDSYHLDSAIATALAKLTATFPAVDEKNANALRDALREDGGEDLPELRDGTQAEPQALLAFDLPADEKELRAGLSADEAFRLLTLPDGSVFVAGRVSHRYTLEQGQIRREAVRARFGAGHGVAGEDTKAGIQVDRLGVVWGRTHADDGSDQFASWSPARGMRRYSLASAWDQKTGINHRAGIDDLDNNWTITADGGVAIHAYTGNIFLLKPGNTRIRTIESDAHLRREAIEALGYNYGKQYPSNRIRLGDGLLWAADAALYAVSPETGKVVDFAPATVSQLFFGSRAAGWVMAMASRPPDGHSRPVLRVADLASGLPRYDLYFGGSMSTAARTANGRLFAVSDKDSLTVFDMQSGTPVARLNAPEDYKFLDVAFSWDGSRLWAYTFTYGSAKPNKLVAWDIPQPLRDPVSNAGDARPDKMRCNVTSSCW